MAQRPLHPFLLIMALLAALAFVGVLSLDAHHHKRLHIRDVIRRRRSSSRANAFTATAKAKHQLLRSAAAAGLLSTSQAFTMAHRMQFEAYEHAVGSGYDVGASDPNQINFTVIARTGMGEYGLVVKTTNDSVLISEDAVPFSFSEMTAVAGDYWSVYDSPDNVICNLNTKGTQLHRFETAFDAMWHNPKFGSSAKNLMKQYEKALQDMIAHERAGVSNAKAKAQTNTNGAVHYGSDYFTSLPAEGASSMFWDMVHSKIAWTGTFAETAHANGNWRGLPYNDDHFSDCARNTYAFGHTEARKDAYRAGVLYRAALERAVETFQNAYTQLSWDFEFHYTEDKHRRSMAELISKTIKFKASLPPTATALHAALNVITTSDILNRKSNRIQSSPEDPRSFAVGVNDRDVMEAQKRLSTAYAKEGFVSHFLSDLFSAGHIRTPRWELRTLCPALIDQAPSAGLTANVMHDEDNWNCLLVRNHETPVHHWWACGDKRFFDEENAQNRRQLRDTIAASLGQVSEAFMAGVNKESDPYPRENDAIGLKMIGTTEGLEERFAVENTCPMFKPKPGAPGKWQARGHWAQNNNLPRPPIARTKASFGSSIRQKMSSDLFPPKESVDIKPLPNRLTINEMMCPYTDFTRNDCCAVAGRATPVFATDDTAGVDTIAARGAVGPNSKTPRAQNTRVTFINRCFISQAVS